MKLQNKTTLILRAGLPAYGGISIARYKGKVVMINGPALPGETVEVNIEKEKKDYYTASVTRIIEPSPHRIEPKCKFFGSCGGCHLQYIPYKKQLQIKEYILRDCLKRLAKIETALSVSITGDNPWNYRYRGQFKISHGNIGFYKGKTKELIDIDNCPLMTEGVNKSLGKVKSLFNEFVDAEEIHISEGDCSIALLKVRSQSKLKTGWNKSAEVFLESGFSGLFIKAGDNKGLKYGAPYITLKLENLKYTISPMSFFQSHWRLNQTVVKFIKDSLLPIKGKKVLDLYSGAGNFSLSLAVDAEVTAVEENPYTVEDGKRNLEINSIKNYRFVQSSAENFQIKDNFHILILDPPRTGLTPVVTNKALEAMPEKIVYLSCNPATLSRDLKNLLKKYYIESIRIIDFFPQTFHIESLVFLSLR